MSNFCGVMLVYGVLLGGVPECAILLRDMLDDLEDPELFGENEMAGEEDDCECPLDVAESAAFRRKYRARVIEALASAGIEAPDRVELAWTGSGDDRPGECATPTDDFVLGFGAHRPPQDWESVMRASGWPASFVDRAELYAWAEMP